MANDLEIGFVTIQNQAKKARPYMNYYHGNQPLRFTYDRLTEVFGKVGIEFVWNICSVVVDAVADRLIFQGWTTKDKAAKDALAEFYKRARVARLSYKIHRDMLTTGNGFAMMDMISGSVFPFHNSPLDVAVVYRDDLPNTVDFGVKRWYDRKEERHYLNLYYQNRIERWKAKTKGTDGGKTPADFELPDGNSLTNPFQRVPIIHFDADELTLENVIVLQDAINKTFSDMMVTGEFAAFPQRYVLTNADLKKVKLSSNTIVQIPKGEDTEEQTQIGSFETAKMDTYLDSISDMQNAASTISRTPKHYLTGSSENLSGEALKTMEAQLIKKCKRQAEAAGEGWQEMATYLTDVPTDDKWDKFETEDQKDDAETIKTLVQSGVPLLVALGKSGWSDELIETVKKGLQEEKKRQADLAAATLADLEARMAAQNDPTGIPE